VRFAAATGADQSFCEASPRAELRAGRSAPPSRTGGPAGGGPDLPPAEGRGPLGPSHALEPFSAPQAVGALPGSARGARRLPQRGRRRRSSVPLEHRHLCHRSGPRPERSRCLAGRGLQDRPWRRRHALGRLPRCPGEDLAPNRRMRALSPLWKKRYPEGHNSTCTTRRSRGSAKPFARRDLPSYAAAATEEP